MKLLLLGLLALCAAVATADEVLAAETAVAHQEEEEGVLPLPPVPFNADAETARNSLQALGSFINMFNINMFDSTGSAQVTDVSNRVINFVVPMLNLMEGADTSDTQYLRQQFASTHGRLDSIGLPLDDAKRLLEWKTTRAMYADYEVFISATSHLLDNYVASAPHERETRKRQFISAFETKRLAALKIYQGVVETDFVVAQNLATAVVHYTQNHRRIVMNFMLAMDRLVLRGAQLEVAYERLLHGLQAAKVTENDWKQRMNRMVARMNSVDAQVKNVWHQQLQADVPNVLAGNRGLSNQDFSMRMYNFLDDKFYWHYWISLAYNEVGGFDNHCISYCFGVHHFRTHGRNMMVASSNPYTSRFTKARGDAWLAQAESAGHRTRHAEVWVNEINRRVGNYCDDAAFRGAICWGCNVWWTVRSDRYSYRKITVGGDVNTILFG